MFSLGGIAITIVVVTYCMIDKTKAVSAGVASVDADDMTTTGETIFATAKISLTTDKGEGDNDICSPDDSEEEVALRKIILAPRLDDSSQQKSLF